MSKRWDTEFRRYLKTATINEFRDSLRVLDYVGEHEDNICRIEAEIARREGSKYFCNEVMLNVDL
jgi:hypothetical protein